MAGFVSRAAWGARPPKSRSTNINPGSVTAHWGGPSPWRGSGFDHSRCDDLVRGWQNFHMDGRGWSDLAYSGVICPHGFVYEGRWRGVRTAANGTNNGNGASYALCYLAGVGDPLTDAAKIGFREGARLLGQGLTKVHSDWKSTACPGGEITGWVHSGAQLPGGAVPGNPGEFLAQILRQIEFCSHGTFSIEHADLQQDCVETWQRVLNHKAGGLNGEPLTTDGYFGPQTEQATKNVQRFVGLPETGIADPPTWEALKR